MAVLIAIYGIVGRWHPPAFLSWSVWLAPTLRFPGYDAVLILLLLVAIAVSRVAWRLQRDSHSATVIRAVNSPIDDLLIAGLSLLCVPIVRFAASYFGPSTFASQYLIPASLGLATEQRWKRSPLRMQRSSWRMRGDCCRCVTISVAMILPTCIRWIGQRLMPRANSAQQRDTR